MGVTPGHAVSRSFPVGPRGVRHGTSRRGLRSVRVKALCRGGGGKRPISAPPNPAERPRPDPKAGVGQGVRRLRREVRNVRTPGEPPPVTSQPPLGIGLFHTRTSVHGWRRQGGGSGSPTAAFCYSEQMSEPVLPRKSPPPRSAVGDVRVGGEAHARICWMAVKPSVFTRSALSCFSTEE